MHGSEREEFCINHLKEKFKFNYVTELISKTNSMSKSLTSTTLKEGANLSSMHSMSFPIQEIIVTDNYRRAD
jgi:hypothetical protein